MLLVQNPPNTSAYQPSVYVDTLPGPHLTSLLLPFHFLLWNPVTSIYTSISVHPLVFLHLSPRLSWSPSPCLRLPSPPPARALMPRTREPQLQLPPARPPRLASLAWDPSEWVIAETECAFYFFLKGKESRLHVVPCVSSSRAVICLFTEGLN